MKTLALSLLVIALAAGCSSSHRTEVPSGRWEVDPDGLVSFTSSLDAESAQDVYRKSQFVIEIKGGSGDEAHARTAFFTDGKLDFETRHKLVIERRDGKLILCQTGQFLGVSKSIPMIEINPRDTSTIKYTEAGNVFLANRID